MRVGFVELREDDARRVARPRRRRACARSASGDVAAGTTRCVRTLRPAARARSNSSQGLAVARRPARPCRRAPGVAARRPARRVDSSARARDAERRADDVGVEPQLLDRADPEAVGGHQAEARAAAGAFLGGDLGDRRGLAGARAGRRTPRRGADASSGAASHCSRSARARRDRRVASGAAAARARHAGRPPPPRTPGSSPVAASRLTTRRLSASGARAARLGRRPRRRGRSADSCVAAVVGFPTRAGPPRR